MQSKAGLKMSSEEKEISVIIPALNEEQQIGRLLDLLHRHSSGYVKEMIVADGGSSDRTIEIASRAGARVVHCKKRGRAIQMNKGADAAEGAILYFLHADTFPPKGYDGMIAGEVQKGAGSGCFTLQFDDNHPLLRFYTLFTMLKTTLVRFGDQSLFVRREDFEQAGGFDESLQVMEDQEIVNRLKTRARFSLIREPVITSARKYRENGCLKLQIIFGFIMAGYYFGARQETLTHLYKTLIKKT